MSRKSEALEITRNNLMEAFWQLYCDKNIRDISVKEIADMAGYNRGTFYNHFKDVYDVLDQIEGVLISQINIDHLNMQMPIAKMVQEELVPLTLNIFKKNAEYFHVLLGPKGDPEFVRKCKVALSPIIRSRFKSVIGVEERVFDLALEYIQTGLFAAINYWFSNRDSMSEEELIMLLQNLSCYGVFPILIDQS